ncbi:MAG TPA: HAMP domain-containing sensor histidine kinase [Bacillales bacterium]|nr:HAMP domain-containing sensor histidine kinase [Bacillales bacterium]
MRKFWRYARMIGGMAAVLLSLCICWTAAYFITPYAFAFIHVSPAPYLRQIINSAFGFFIFGTAIIIITKIFNPDKRQRAFWDSLMETFEQISRGNFNVKVSQTLLFAPDKHPEHPFSKLVNSINDMAEQLEEMEQMRQEFVSNVSHEIQSPLTSISGFAAALQNDRLSSEERRHYLEIIEKESKRLSKLSENLLKLTSLESEHHPFDRKIYRLDRQLRAIILACEPQWTAKNLGLDVSLDEVDVAADEQLMSQVWVNLIHNSIKFTPAGGKISVYLRKEDGKAVVRIVDTGVGMAEDAKTHVFERFYKADKSRNREGAGSGLGLSIVKKIVDMHEGEITLESDAGKGTEMIVSLACR